MKIDSAVKKLQKFFTSHKRLPSYQEMCLLFGFASKKASFELAKKLIKLGVVEKDETGRLIPKQLFPQLKLLGSIAAGTPSPAEEQLLSTMSFDHFLVNRPDRSFILKVSGDSMVEAGIHDGDLVVIEKGVIPSEGDIVVAEVDGDFTLKYLKRQDGQAYLMPANSRYSPIYPEENLTIFGIVVSVIRKYH
ncbi:repressor LexA [Candidatus Gottesmanbacteria bacterium]|nr:repressor LexA [Candidatus Gottesmanbacteria bacterium]